MTNLNLADAIKLGSSTVDAVYLGATKVWPQSLAAWFAALAGSGSAQARVMWIGDSILEGTGTSLRARRSIELTTAEMRRSHQVAGYDVCQYLPAHFGMPNTITPWAPNWRTSGSGTITDLNGGISGGSGTKSNTFGLGTRSSVLATDAVATYTVTGTDVDVWTNASGTFAVSIDGAAYGATVDTSGQNAYADITQVSLGATGSHTVAVKAVSGPLNFLGLTVYDGGRAKGVVSFDHCHYGAVIPDYYDVGTPLAPQNAIFERNLALVDPHLVVVNLGVNDALSYSVVQVQTNFEGLLNFIKATVPDATVLYVQTYTQVPDSTVVNGDGSTAGQYAAQLPVACAAVGVPLFALTPPMPPVYSDTDGNYQADGLHPTDAGHALLAATIGPEINPLYGVYPMSIEGTLPGGVAGAAYSHTLTLAGTAVGAVTFTEQPSWMTVTLSGTTITCAGTLPGAAETDSFTLTATDSASNTATSAQSIVISAAPTGIALVNQTTASTTTATYSCPLPSGSGGVLIFAIGECNAGGAGPAGWTSVFNAGYFGSDGQNMRVYVRVADGTEGANITGTAEGHYGRGAAMIAQRWSGVDTTTPIVAYDYDTGGSAHASPTTVTAPSITAVDGSTLLFFAAVDTANDASIKGFTTPTGYTGGTFEGITLGEGNVFAAYKLSATAGATGTVSSNADTETTTSKGWAAGLIALNPA